MTTRLEWVENEIKLAKEEADEYGKSFLDDLLVAYKSLMFSGHTGYTFGKTRDYVIRLIEGKPLTAIKDTPDIWKQYFYLNDASRQTFCCTRYPSLYKYVLPNGEVKYSDLYRVYLVNIRTGDTLRNEVALDIVDKLYPIEMPYYPPLGYFKIYFDDDDSNIICRYLIEPDGRKVELDMNEKGALKDE